MEGQTTTRYAILRDGARWDGVTTNGLEPDAGGALVLARVSDAAVSGAVGAASAEGLLEVGPLPLDAGERAEWERVVVEAEAPEKTSVTLEVFAHDEPSVASEEMRWKSLPTLDALVPSAEEWGAEQRPGGLRFLWVRVRLRSDDGSAGPRLLQVSAATAGETYLDYLPAFYRRDEETRSFLGRWLGLFRAELGDLETALEQMPRGFEPALAREEYLPWLSGWLAFDLPFGRGTETSRRLLRRAPRLYERRGTPAGLAEFIELYTGVRPRIVEAFAERKIWQLDVTSALGVDTVLPSASLGGMVVPDPAAHPAVGEVVVGESGPLPRDEFGETLFNETAHRFRVVVPADGMSDELRHAIARIVDAEKPAHAEYQLCVESDEQGREGQPEESAQPESALRGADSAAAPRPAGEAGDVSPSGASGLGAKGVGESLTEDESATGFEATSFETASRADTGLRVEAVEFLDARNRVAGTLEHGAEPARFPASAQVNAVRVRFSRPVDLSSVVTGGKRENPAGFSFLLQANWSRRAAKYVPGAVFLDSRDTRAVRFVPTTAHGSLRAGSYTVTLYGGGDEAARPAIKDMDGQELRGAANDEGGNFVFRFQITA
jgi:phage tail-like protein